MAVLAAADIPQVQAQHARVDRLIRAGLVDLTPVIQRCTTDMYATAKATIASENQGRNPRRRPNTIAGHWDAAAGRIVRGPALGGPTGTIARGTRVVGIQTRGTPRVYDILCFSTPVGEMMQTGTKAHTITAHNPSGRLAFTVLAGGQSTNPLRRAERVRRIGAATPARAGRARTVASRLLAGTQITWRTPQAVAHPGTPPRPFLVYDGPYFDAHLWAPAVRYITLATEGTLGGVL